MTQLRRFWIAIVLALVCAACSSNAVPTLSEQGRELWENPAPLPDFIVFLTRSSDDFSTPTRDICAYINEYVVWEPGDYGNDTSEAIQRTAEMLINGQIFTELTFRVEAAAFIRFQDASRQIELGSHNATTAVCVDASNLSPGYYIATLQFASTSGVGYSHTWAFWLKE